MAKKKLKKVDATIGRRADGTPVLKPFYGLTVAEAKGKAEAYQNDIGYEKRLISENEFYFRGWAARWLLTYKKPFVTPNAYYTTYENPTFRHLLPAFGARLLADITPEEVQAFYNSKTYLSASMCSKMTMCLNAIFETALDNDRCYKNPARFCRLESDAIPGVKEVYEDKQIKIAEHWFMREMPEVVLMLETGVRREDMVGWHKTDFDTKRMMYHVRRSITALRGGGFTIGPPKDDSYRTNPLSPVGLQAYRRLLDLYPDTEYLLGGPFDGHQHPEHWSARLKTEMGRLAAWHPDIPKLTAHELRHTYGTYLRRHGVDIYTIAKILGHRSIEVTSNTYVHNEITALKKALKFTQKQELIAI